MEQSRQSQTLRLGSEKDALTRSEIVAREMEVMEEGAECNGTSRTISGGFVWTRFGYAHLGSVSAHTVHVRYPWGHAFVRPSNVTSAIQLDLVCFVAPEKSQFLKPTLSPSTQSNISLTAPIRLTLAQLREQIASQLGRNEYSIEITCRGRRYPPSDPQLDQLPLYETPFRHGDTLMVLANSNSLFCVSRTLSHGVHSLTTSSKVSPLPPISLYFGQLRERSVQFLQQLSPSPTYLRRVESCVSERELYYIFVSCLCSRGLLDAQKLSVWVDKGLRIQQDRMDLQESMGKLVLIVELIYQSCGIGGSREALLSKGIVNGVSELLSMLESNSEDNKEKLISLKTQAMDSKCSFDVAQILRALLAWIPLKQQFMPTIQILLETVQDKEQPSSIAARTKFNENPALWANIFGTLKRDTSDASLTNLMKGLVLSFGDRSRDDAFRQQVRSFDEMVARLNDEEFIENDL